MEVDHIVEIGGYTSFNGSWDDMFARMFPRPVEKHLQCLCKACHARKTGAYNAASVNMKRKPIS